MSKIPTYPLSAVTDNTAHCAPKDDPLKAYLLERRRALLAEVAGIERLLGIEKKTVDKR